MEKTSINNNMKYIMSMFLSFMGLSVQAANLLAEDAVWYSKGNQPEVEVFLQDSKLLAKVWQDIPPIVLQHLNSYLYEVYGRNYVRIDDFNKDEVTDIGILEGASLGGGSLCYAVYEYLPDFYSFKNKVSFSWCN